MKGMELFAAIDIGSNSIKMKIVSIDEKQNIGMLEELRKNIALGKDTFNYNRISTEVVLKLCETLKDFRSVMKLYDVKHYKAVATSAIREADNRDLVIDMIKQQTGFEVQVINGSQEKYLTYLALEEIMREQGDFRQDGALVLDIGAGSVEVSLFYNNQIQRTYSVQTGVLRLKEVLMDLERMTMDYPRLLGEYIDAYIYDVRNDIAGLEIENFIAIGGEVAQLRRLCAEACMRENEIDRTKFDAIYTDFLKMPLPAVMRKYHIHSENADHFLPTLILIQKFIDMTASERILLSNTSLRDGMIAHECLLKDPKVLSRDIIDSAWGLVNKYHGNQKHLKQVIAFAQQIFNEVHTEAGLEERDSLLLQLATILHEVGHYISVMDLSEATYDIIMYSDLIGVSDAEIHMIANIAKYSGDNIPSYHEILDKGFDEEKRIKVKKLSAILCLANAMDKSKGKKLTLKSMKIKKGELRIKCHTENDALLESWEFQRRSERFFNVFGILPKLQIKGNEDVLFK